MEFIFFFFFWGGGGGLGTRNDLGVRDLWFQLVSGCRNPWLKVYSGFNPPSPSQLPVEGFRV